MRPKVDQIVAILKSGGVIAFPTDTVYGIGCDVFNLQAVERIYQIKGRDYNKPLPIIFSKIDDFSTYTQDISEFGWQIIKKYLPGPLTVVVKKKGIIPDLVTAGASSVAVRVIEHPVLSPILKMLGGPIVATSANLAGEPDPLTASDVRKNLGNKVDLIVDGGKCEIGRPTTILDLTTDPPQVLRQGFLKIE